MSYVLPHKYIPWFGGENPVPGQRVDLIFNDKSQIKDVLSNWHYWRWDARSVPEARIIVGYKITNKIEDEK